MEHIMSETKMQSIENFRSTIAKFEKLGKQ